MVADFEDDEKESHDVKYGCPPEAEVDSSNIQRGNMDLGPASTWNLIPSSAWMSLEVNSSSEPSANNPTPANTLMSPETWNREATYAHPDFWPTEP